MTSQRLLPPTYIQSPSLAHFYRIQNFDGRIPIEHHEGDFESHFISTCVLCTVKLHKRGPFLQTAGHPFPLLLGQPSSALLSTVQAGGPPSAQIGWATKTIIFEDVRSHKMTPFFTCKFFGQFAMLGIFFSPCLLVKIIQNSHRKMGATK